MVYKTNWRTDRGDGFHLFSTHKSLEQACKLRRELSDDPENGPGFTGVLLKLMWLPLQKDSI